MDTAARARELAALGIEVRKFNPDEPRIPGGHAGGGRWGSIGGAVKKGLKALGRPTVADTHRDTAAGRPDLIAAGHGEAIAAAAYEAARTHGGGNENTGHLAGRMLYRGGGVGAHGDEALHHIAAQQGFEGHAAVVSRAEMDQHVKRGAVEMFRGVRKSPDGTKTPAQIHEQIRSGEAYHGLGFSGNGMYMSSSRSEASRYGSVGRYALRPDARIVDYRELLTEMADYFKSVGRDSMAGQVFEDPGRYAAARGYDAIRWRRGEEVGKRPGEEDEFIILNRTALLAEAP